MCSTLVCVVFALSLLGVQNLNVQVFPHGPKVGRTLSDKKCFADGQLQALNQLC